MAVDIRLLGQSCFELKAGGRDGARRPVPDRQPEGRGDGRRGASRT